MSEPKNITDVLETVEDEVDSKRLSLGQIIDTFEHRGYGPLLLTAALIIVLPTGGIPGVPTAIGAAIILIASQLAYGRSSPWLPQKLRKLGFKKAAFDKGADKIKPFTRRIDYIIKPRLKYLTCGLAARMIGVTCVAVAALLPFTEVVPFSDIIPGLAIAMLGLGLTARDGIAIIIGWVFATGAITLIAYLFFF